MAEVENFIIEESIPVFSEETNAYVQRILADFIGPIEQWIVSANQYLLRGGASQDVYDKVFTTNSGDAARGVTWGGGQTKATTLQNQLALHANSLSNLYSAGDFSGDYLLKTGYKLLTRLGEALRHGKEVMYEIYVHSVGADFSINDMVRYKLNLDDFIDKASISTNGYELNLKTRNQMDAAGLSGIDMTHSIWLAHLNTFIEQVSGYFLFAGKEREHPFAKEGAKLKTINYGQVIESMLNYPEGIQDNLDLSDYMYAKGEAYWSNFDERVEADYPRVLAILETLSKPSPFWQGGEGGKGSKLQGTQVKASGASITNMKTLVRQMLRVRMITRGISSKAKTLTAQKTREYIGGKNYTQQIYEGIGRMFDRDFSRNRSIYINL